MTRARNVENISMRSRWLPRVVTLELPLPPVGLSTNRKAGRHYLSYQKLKHAYQEAIYSAASLQLGERIDPLKRCVVTLWFFFCSDTERRMDWDNCVGAAKHLIDVLTTRRKGQPLDALRLGLLVDDNPTRLACAGVYPIKCSPRCRCGGRVVARFVETPSWPLPPEEKP